MGTPQRIYLDNAATSFPKPACVYEAVDRYNREIGVAVGRGAYRRAMEVEAVVASCRSRLARLFGAESPERIVFTFNATDALNLALHGLLGPGDHVVTSVMEHNSVLRPLADLRRRCDVEVSYVGADATGRIDAADVRSQLRPETRLIALIHASNVTGTLQPIEEVAEIAQSAGVLLLVDAAQSAGHLPIDLSQLPVDLMACAGHKGLLGPLGTGVLYIRPGVEQQLRSLRQGGTGSQSEKDEQPEHLPDKYESGNHNAPGLFGLEAALAWIEQRGIADIRRHECALTERLLDGLHRCPGLRVHGPSDAEQRVGVVSVTSDAFEPQVLATILDERFGIEVRAGLHCAPRAHRAVGTLDGGGTVRFSVGPFTQEADIDAAVAALLEMHGRR